MPLKPLDNLVKTGQLKKESPAKDEFESLVRSARIKLKDSNISSLSLEVASSLFIVPPTPYL